MLRQLLISITDLVIGLIEFLIGLRVILKIFGASQSASFVSWVNETTQPLVQPFAGIFPSPRLEGLFVIEFSALFALVVYALIGYLIASVLVTLPMVDRYRQTVD